MRTVRLMLVFEVVLFGVLASLATGLVRNEQGVRIPEINRYGYPLVWMVTDLNGPTRYILTNFAVDAAFWVAITFVALALLKLSFSKPSSEAS